MSNSILPDNTDRIFDNILKRVPLSLLKKVFKQHGLLAGQSVPKTQKKIEQYLEQSKELAALKKIMDWYIHDYHFHGEKAVYFYRLQTEEAEKLIQHLQDQPIPESDHARHFPLTIADECLQSMKNEVHLVNIQQYGTGIAITYSTIKQYTNRLNLSPDTALTEEVLESYQNIETIQIEQAIYRQFFDIIIVHKDGLVELRIDNPRMDKGKQLLTKDRYNAFQNLIDKVKKHGKQALGKQWRLPPPINLLSVINKIYFNKQEGNIRYIRFTTNNGNVKESKASVGKTTDCCRQDTYTKAGTKAVNNCINPFRLQVQWSRMKPESLGKHEIELQILGTVNHLNFGKNPLNEAIISRVMNQFDYEFIRGKILSYID